MAQGGGLGQLMQQMQRGNLQNQRPSNSSSPFQPGGMASRILQPGQSPLMGGGGMQGGGFQPGTGFMPGGGGFREGPMGDPPPGFPQGGPSWGAPSELFPNQPQPHQPGMMYPGGSPTFREGPGVNMGFTPR